MVMVQVPVPGQETPEVLDQPVKVEPVAGEAVSVTEVPELKDGGGHVVPQLTLAGLLVTVPAPVPDLLIVRVYVGELGVGVGGLGTAGGWAGDVYGNCGPVIYASKNASGGIERTITSLTTIPNRNTSCSI